MALRQLVNIGIAASFSLLSPLLNVVGGETLCWKIAGVSAVCEQKKETRRFFVHLEPCYLPPSGGRGFHLNGEDFDTVLRYFGANGPNQILGKWFASPSTLGASRAGLSLLALAQKAPANKSVSSQVIYERAALALSRFQVPDYSDLNPLVVLKAYEAAFDCGKTLSKPRIMSNSKTMSTLGWGANPEWLMQFCGRVSQLSRGQVRVRRIDCGKDEMGSSCTGHGPQCEYEELVAVSLSGRKLRFNLGYRDTYPVVPKDQDGCTFAEYWRK